MAWMKTPLPSVLLILLAFASVPSHAMAGSVEITNESRSVLLGSWTGEVVAIGGGKVRFKSDVTLTVDDDPAFQGEFTLHKTNSSWVTDIEFAEGKVIMTYGRKKRAFVLEEDSGQNILRTEYDSTWKGYKRKNTLILRK